LAGCAVCFGVPQSTYPSVYPAKLRNDGIPLEARRRQTIEDLTAELGDPMKEFWVAVEEHDQEGGLMDAIAADGMAMRDPEILGYCIWQRPGALERDVQAAEAEKAHEDAEAFNSPRRVGDKASSIPSEDTASSSAEAQRGHPFKVLLHAECDHELAAKLKKEKLAACREHCGYDSWFLQNLFVAPAHQRRGVGTALMEHGFDRIEAAISEKDALDADSSRPVIALTSSPEGQKLYTRYGFEAVYWFRPHVVDLNERGELAEKKVSWPLMVKRTH